MWGLELPVALTATIRRIESDESVGLANRVRAANELATLYLFGMLSFVEGRHGEHCWDGIGATSTSPPMPSFPELEYSALNAVRNALMHNNGDLNNNRKTVSADEIKVIQSWCGTSLAHHGSGELVVSLSAQFIEELRLRFVSLWTHLTE